MKQKNYKMGAILQTQNASADTVAAAYKESGFEKIEPAEAGSQGTNPKEENANRASADDNDIKEN